MRVLEITGAWEHLGDAHWRLSRWVLVHGSLSLLVHLTFAKGRWLRRMGGSCEEIS